MNKLFSLLLGTTLPLLSFSQVNEVNFNHQNINFSAAPRTTLSPMSMKLWDNYNNGGPSTYGTVLEIYGLSGHQTSQLYFGGWDSSRIRYREAFYAQNTWSDWVTLLDSKNNLESSGSLMLTGNGPHYLANGKLGVGTTNPISELQVKGVPSFDSSTRFYLTNNASAYGRTNLILTGRFHDNNDAWIFGSGARNSIVFAQNASASGTGIGDIGSEKYSIQLEGNSNSLGFLSAARGNNPSMVLTQQGNLGIGTVSPEGKLHITGVGSLLDANNINQYGGDLIIQAQTNGRTTTKGAALEFVIPANTDGSNPWGQGRILTVAGNELNGNATGKMILGTRRMFNKVQTGSQWYYGNDIVIDHVGNVGIGTLTPTEQLSVKGKIRAQEIKVELTNWPDYVFTKEHKLPSLTDLESYIKSNNHLPEIPSAKEVEAEGVSLGEMNKKLLQKIEELTLYMIEQGKDIKDIKAENQALKKELSNLKSELK